jgi:hypothetical protein
LIRNQGDLSPERGGTMSDRTLVELLEQYAPAEYRIRPLTEALIVFAGVMVAVVTTVYFIYARALDAQKAEIRDGLARTAHVVASQIDATDHRRFLAPEDEQLPEYQRMDAMMLRFLRADPKIAYLYTAIEKDGKVHFILDPTPAPTDPNEEDKSVTLMDEYEDANPEILRALRERTVVVSEEPYTDAWGTFVSGYVPLVDAQGEFFAVLGMDLEVSEYFNRLEPIKRATVRAMVTGFFIAFLTAAAVWFLRNFILVLNRRRLALYREIRERVAAGSAA